MSSQSEGDDFEGRVNQFGSELAELSDEELAKRANQSVEEYCSFFEDRATESLGFSQGWFC
jgi:hypothetical protein